MLGQWVGEMRYFGSFTVFSRLKASNSMKLGPSLIGQSKHETELFYSTVIGGEGVSPQLLTGL